MDLQHLPDVIKTSLETIERYGPAAIETVAKIVGNRRRAAQSAAEVARRDQELSNILELVESLVAEIDSLRDELRWNVDMAERQALDPEFEQFATQAVENAACSRSEARRRSFGRYIARRLQVDTDEEILRLRRAMAITFDLTDAQLLALSAAGLVQRLGTPSLKFRDRDDAEKWLADRYSDALARFIAIQWNYDDLETLGAVGALGGGLMGGTSVWGSESAYAVDAWLLNNGLPTHDQLSDDAGGSVSRARSAASFPVITQLRRLASGHLFDERMEALNDAARLDRVRLTPVGWTIAEIILEQLVPRR